MSAELFASLFDDPADWSVVASGQAAGRLSRGGNSSLRLDFDFHGGGGFVVIHREIRMRMPETFRIGFVLRGGGLPNHFEFKLSDPVGANVWRNLRPDFSPPEIWKPFRISERELPFAWGPAGGGSPGEVGSVEFVIAAGPGGEGFLELAAPVFDDESFREPLSVRASSERPGGSSAAVFSGGTGWRAAAGDAEPVWQVDFGRPQRFGGVVIDWPDDLPPRSYVMETSADGERWVSAQRATAATGARSHIPVPGARGAAPADRLRELRMRGAAGIRPAAGRVLQHAERIHPSRGRGLSARMVPPLLAARTILLDARRQPGRKTPRPDQRGGHGGGGRGGIFVRAVSCDRRRTSSLGRTWKPAARCQRAAPRSRPSPGRRRACDSKSFRGSMARETI